MTEPTEPQQPTAWYFEPPIPQMTLRDWFAGQALAGFAADPNVATRSTENRHNLAIACYQLADAMMKARGEE
jgi:hypothetical protein